MTFLAVDVLSLRITNAVRYIVNATKYHMTTIASQIHDIINDIISPAHDIIDPIIICHHYHN